MSMGSPSRQQIDNLHHSCVSLSTRSSPASEKDERIAIDAAFLAASRLLGSLCTGILPRMMELLSMKTFIWSAPWTSGTLRGSSLWSGGSKEGPIPDFGRPPSLACAGPFKICMHGTVPGQAELLSGSCTGNF